MKELELPAKLEQFSCWRDSGHPQLFSGSNELPKCHFVLDLLKRPHELSVGTRLNSNTNGGTTTTLVLRPHLSSAHCSIIIALEPDMPQRRAIANHLHRCEPS